MNKTFVTLLTLTGKQTERLARLQAMLPQPDNAPRTEAWFNVFDAMVDSLTSDDSILEKLFASAKPAEQTSVIHWLPVAEVDLVPGRDYLYVTTLGITFHGAYENAIMWSFGLSLPISEVVMVAEFPHYQKEQNQS